MSYNKTIRGTGIIMTGDADGVADTILGVVTKEDGITVDMTFERFDLMVNGFSGAVKIERDLLACKITAPVFDFTTSTIAHAFGLDADATLQFGGDSPTAQKERSVKVLLTTAEGVTVVFDVPAAMAGEDTQVVAARGDWSKVPITLESLDGAGRGCSLKTDGGSTIATISGGVLTRSAGIGYLKVLGEGDASDSVDSIGGATLANLETLVLQTGKAANVITLTDLAGTLELASSEDFLFADAGDWIVLQYDLSGTKWVEIGRYVNPQPSS